MLGLGGPGATDDEVKKAYRNLARREHPDKAGHSNKLKFQAIQHAYSSVLKQRGDVTGVSTAPGHDVGDVVAIVSANVTEARGHATAARLAAEGAGMCAHRALRASEEGTLQRRKAMGPLRDLAKKGAQELVKRVCERMNFLRAHEFHSRVRSVARWRHYLGCVAGWAENWSESGSKPARVCEKLWRG